VEQILLRQAEDRQTAEQIFLRQAQDMQTNKEHFYKILQHLDLAEQQNAEMQTTLQQAVTAQKAQILQIQSDHAKTIQQVRSLVKQHEHMRTDAKNTKESMATLEAGAAME
jgi:hypothetical protein